MQVISCTVMVPQNILHFWKLQHCHFLWQSKYDECTCIIIWKVQWLKLASNENIYKIGTFPHKSEDFFLASQQKIISKFHLLVGFCSCKKKVNKKKCLLLSSVKEIIAPKKDKHESNIYTYPVYWRGRDSSFSSTVKSLKWTWCCAGIFYFHMVIC